MDNKLKIGMRVELLPGREDVYPRAYPASLGIVRGMKEDSYGYPQVYVEWDEKHWRYNGESDLWTFASHFRPAEGERELIGAEVHDVSSAMDQVPSGEDEEVFEEYLDVLMTACDKAAESDAFFFICMKKDDQGRTRLEILNSSTDEDLRQVSNADVFRFAEQEMRRRGM